MPYTPKQEKFFEAVAHGMKPTTSDLDQGTAKKLAAEAKGMPAKRPISGQARAFAELHERNNDHDR